MKIALVSILPGGRREVQGGGALGGFKLILWGEFVVCVIHTSFPQGSVSACVLSSLDFKPLSEEGSGHPQAD